MITSNTFLYLTHYNINHNHNRTSVKQELSSVTMQIA